MVEIALAGGVLFRRRSSAYPRVLGRNSTGFAQRERFGIPQQIREFFACSSHVFIGEYQQLE
jgi:hypothetical protein